MEGVKQYPDNEKEMWKRKVRREEGKIRKGK